MSDPSEPATTLSEPTAPPPGSHRDAVSYIDKSRTLYEAYGYDQAYRWATNTDAPFTSFSHLNKPLAQCRVGVVTTAYPIREDGTQEVSEPALVLTKEPYHAPSDPVPDAMFTDDLSWDKEATHTDDVDTFLPLRQLTKLAAEGRIGSVAPRFYGVPTEYSQRRTRADAAVVEQWCREDDVDVVLLVPL